VFVWCSTSNDTEWKSKKEHQEILEFQQSMGSAGAAWGGMEPAGVLLSYGRVVVERGGFLFMSKDVEWKLRQERGVFGDEAQGRAMEVEEEEHEGRLEFQPSVGSGRCSRSLEPAGVLYTGTRWFSVHVERCGMEAETGAWSLWY